MLDELLAEETKLKAYTVVKIVMRELQEINDGVKARQHFRLTIDPYMLCL